MKQISQHELFVSGKSYQQCRDQVASFFRKTNLVRYDSIKIRDERSVSGLDDSFQSRTLQAIDRNRGMVRGLLDELRNAGYEKIEELLGLPQGYESKTLHIITHMLDGFIGIDSYFYNLVDDSHWIPSPTEEKLQQNPDLFWLIPIDCYSATPEEAGLLHKSKS